MMKDGTMMVADENGVFGIYDDTYDVIIHCESEEEQKMVMETLKKTVNPWIPIAERFPEEPLNSVIGWDTSRNRCCFVQYINGQWKLGNWDPVDIVAWMPLPQPWEGE